MSGEQIAVPVPHGSYDIRPYIVKTYDRWIILVLVLVGGWLLFRPLFAFSVYYRGVSFEHMFALTTAEHYYRKAIGVDARIPEGWLGLGGLQMMDARDHHDRYLAAVDTFTRGLSFNPKSDALAFNLCRVYYEIGQDYPHALAACQQAVQSNPSDHFAWDYAAWSSFNMGKRDQALTYWREALRHGHLPALKFIQRYSKDGR